MLARAVGGGSPLPAPIVLLRSIDDVLAEYGTAMDACRAYLFVTPDAGRTVDNTNEWCRSGVAPAIDGMQGLPVAQIGALWARLLQDHVVVVPSVRDLPPGWESERAILEGQGIEALVLAAVATADGVVGFVGLDFTVAPREFGADEIATLRVLAETTGRVIERTSGEVALEQVQRDLRGAFDAAPIGMALLDHRGRILRANQALAALVQRDLAQLHGLHATGLLHPADAMRHAEAFRELRRGAGRHLRLEVALVTPGGEDVDVAVTAGSYGGIDDACRVVMHVEDVSERRAFEAELAHSRLHDPVTALPNRKLAVDRIGVAMRSTTGHGQIGVLCLDVDRFRTVNDRLGHAVGDQVLAAVGARLAAAAPEGATVARLGADEFMVVVPVLDGDRQAVELADRLRAAIAEPLPLPSTVVHLSATVGIAVSSRTRQEPADELLQRADMALHTARETGCHVQLLDTHGVLARARRLELENQLSSALRNEELTVAYQPVHDVTTSRVVGVEALLRWPGGSAPVEQLIEIAERSSLILDLGRYALQQAVAALPALSVAARSDLVLSVNLSARQLHHDDVVADIAAALEAHGVAPDRLCVEVTETVAMVDTARSVDVLGRLQALGVRVAIDDFGTGYSSLSYLRDLPADEVKIDRSFLAGAAHDPAMGQMLEGMVRLCRGLGLDVVGEGVETEEQLAVLAAAGCTRWQGFLSTPALPPHLLSEWFATSHVDGAVVVDSFEARVHAQGYEDVLVFQRVGADRYAHIGGIGRGRGWAGIVEIDLDSHPELARSLGDDDLCVVVDPDATHVVGPYHARSAVVALVEDGIVVFGHQRDAHVVHDQTELRTLAVEAATSITDVAPAKPLADELEILEAVQRLLQFDGTGVVAAVHHLATTAAAVLSCDIALAWTPRSGLVTVGLDEEPEPALVKAISDMPLPGALCIQDAGRDDLPAGLVERLGIRSWYALPMGDDGGRLLVAHTDAGPRGFTMLCQRLGRTLVVTSEVLVRSAATRQHLHEAVDRAAAEARRDALTGVANRLAWDEALATVRGTTALGVFIIDVDNLKEVNDRLGHAVGDRLLQEVARVLEQAVAPRDQLARIGGDEFAILLTGERGDACGELHAAIRRGVASLEIPGLDEVGVSIGWSTGVGAAQVATATRRADQRMYRDKARRRPASPVG